MGKLKTHKGVAKRIKVSGTGKIRHFRVGRRHLLTGKASSRTRKMRRLTSVSAVEVKKLRRLIPYSS